MMPPYIHFQLDVFRVASIFYIAIGFFNLHYCFSTPFAPVCSCGLSNFSTLSIEADIRNGVSDICRKR